MRGLILGSLVREDVSTPKRGRGNITNTIRILFDCTLTYIIVIVCNMFKLPKLYHTWFSVLLLFTILLLNFGTVPMVKVFCCCSFDWIEDDFQLGFNFQCIPINDCCIGENDLWQKMIKLRDKLKCLKWDVL